ncbi:unnamed protein product [Malassezia sympodialis ATCC 42132]|uniref:TRIP4/RQT4 C2HC5-type zinc finger domain-containing protein n=1 Tax=Malassezia sympodialis (strain ATCC 42132) TaxID=1230383 RepID=M5E931_MALS4|nr:uncharacterized protein MSY001_1658 [Malassezia sympodialis ATCC 42132]CCU98952.1 unnamed protein product [Malassezia sympodialis ATCC 42132]SHO78948.1 Uncharacterized protein MSYG_3297 [Malassezia sympodialis ATCC 42132]|eukprot:XP_018740226.1 uncharacterized protein MSY001_1658 [Malassezia sympodialis ATCC 42132]
MASPEQALGALLGLDEATVSDQIVPYLRTHKTPKALRLYMQDLIGTSPEAKALADRWVAVRFPAREPPRPRDTKGVRLTPATVTAALAESEERAQPRTLEPTADMKALDAAFAMLSTEPCSTAAASYKPARQRLCLCQGQRHGLAKWAPLCVACGLILCAALRPVPVSPWSVCPSCQQSPVVPAQTRTHMLSDMVDMRERLEREQYEEAAQRHAEWMAQHASGQLPQQAFPSLHGAPASAPARAAAPAPSRARVLHLDMKTHKVTMARAKPSKAGSASSTPPSDAGAPSEWATTAEDGSPLLHDWDDDLFRQAFGREAAPPKQGSRWADVPCETSLRGVYVPKERRGPLRKAVESESLTEVPDLADLLRRTPPGSHAAQARRNDRTQAAAAAVARSHGRKSGKAAPRRKNAGSA